METLAFRRALAAFGVVFALASVSANTARADDVVQIEKATKLEGEAESWSSIGCFDKANELLASADKELQGVDETGKADVVAKMKDCRAKMADTQKNWDAASYKAQIERQINSGESDAQHGNDLGYTRAQAMLDDSWTKSHLGAGVAELQKKLDWSKKKITSEANRGAAQRLNGFINQLFEGIEHNSKNASNGWGVSQERFDDYSQKIEAHLDSDEGKKLLSADEIAGYRKRLEKAKADLASATADTHIAATQAYVTKVQDMLDHPEKVHYWSDVEQQIGYAEKSLPNCPADDPRTKKLKATIEEQRKTLASKQSATERDETVNPAIKYWAQVKDGNMKNAEGWEQETTPSKLADFIHHSPPSLGCDKTFHLLSNVVQIWLDNDMTKKAQEKYPNDPEWKKTYDEVEALRDKAEEKFLKFAGSIIDEADKLPEGKDRQEMKSHFYNLKNEISRATGGGTRRKGKGKGGTPDAGGADLEARIDAIEKKWTGDKAAAEGAKKDLDKKLVDAANAVWPGMLGEFKTTKLDAPDALAHNGSWLGKYVHIKGGARGVNLNRSGWDYEDQFYFIVDMDGVPVAGNLDSGLEEAFEHVEKTTGIRRDSEEEIVGIIDGTCKVWTLFHYANGNKSVRDRQVDAVRLRIVALKSVTVAAACGQGTNLQKLSEYKDVSVSQSGSGSFSGHGGGFFHMIHRFIAWGMCALLALTGLAAAAHGASKFVPQIQEQKAKAGDYLGYAGVGLAVAGVLWFGAAIVGWVLGLCELGSLPSIALIFAGASIGLDLARSKGKLKEETASMIQPVAILFGLGCIAAAGLHFLFWDVMLL